MNAGPSVLLVEDDLELLGAIRASLRSRGCTVDAAATGSEALRCILRGGYHAVITGTSLPRIDGMELTRLLSRRVQSPCIVLLTSSSDPELLRQGYAAGATHVLSKPLSMTALARLLENLAVP
jgi:CheY-like chemotaxis protein